MIELSRNVLNASTEEIEGEIDLLPYSKLLKQNQRGSRINHGINGRPKNLKFSIRIEFFSIFSTLNSYDFFLNL